MGNDMQQSRWTMVHVRHLEAIGHFSQLCLSELMNMEMVTVRDLPTFDNDKQNGGTSIWYIAV